MSDNDETRLTSIDTALRDISKELGVVGTQVGTVHIEVEKLGKKLDNMQENGCSKANEHTDTIKRVDRLEGNFAKALMWLVGGGAVSGGLGGGLGSAIHKFFTGAE